MDSRASCIGGTNWCWKGPIYFTIAVMLAFLAITTAFRNTGSSSNSSAHNIVQPSSPLNLTPPAVLNLKSSGFGIFATLMQLSPALFFGSSLSNSTTIFAVRDSAIHSLSPMMLNDLAKYHTVAANLSMDELMKKTEHACFKTLFQSKNVSVTRKIVKKRFIEINHVPVSDPNLVLEPQVTIHGVATPFLQLNQVTDFSSVPDPDCGLITESKNVERVHWMKIVQSLRSKKLNAFASGLQSVLPNLIKNCSNVTSVTILAPPDLGSVTTRQQDLADIVKVHILAKRLTYKELKSLHYRALLKTLIPGQELVFTGRGNGSQRLSISGAQVIGADVIKARDFVVHRVAKALKIAELHHSS